MRDMVAIHLFDIDPHNVERVNLHDRYRRHSPGLVSLRARCTGCATTGILRLLLLLCAAPLVAHASAAQPPRNLALLIGVSHYPNLPAQYQLHGPANDIALMRRLLSERGFQVTALGAAGGEQPTRAAIISAMRHLAAIANRGDFVLVLFSGHGSQQPEGAASGYPRKPDGIDETFLPADVAHWNDAVETVSGALLDHEVGSLINAIRNKGAFVWSVFDSCHSATMTRAMQRRGERDRRVPPQALGVPESARTHRGEAHVQLAPGSETAFVKPVLLSPAAGGAAAFYAAQTDETTPELALPEGAAHGRIYGLFTYTLAQAISSAPTASYRQLAQYILQSYAAMNRTAPTPLFEGDLDRAAFGASTDQGAHPIRQWRLSSSSSGLTLSAGTLSQVGTGALLWVLPQATAADTAAIGVVQVTQALETTSHVVWTSDPRLLRRAGWTGPRPPPEPQLPAGAFARLAASGVDFQVRVARPVACRAGAAGSIPVCSPGTGGPETGLLALVNQALDTHAQGFPDNAIVVDPSATADIRPLVYGSRLWLAPAGGELVTGGEAPTYSLPLSSTSTQDAAAYIGALRQVLFDALAREARAINLERLAAQVQLNAALAFTARFDVTSGNPSTRTSTGFTAGGSIPTVHDGDQVSFELSNHGFSAVDVTLLDIDPQFGVTPVFPQRGESNRLTPGSVLDIPGTIEVRPQDAGRETMLIIATAAQPDQERQDFSDLAQPPLQADRSARHEAAAGLSGLLWEAAFGSGARAKVLRRTDPAEILCFSWNTRSP